MLISELIKKLQAEKKKWGDIPVVIPNHEFATSLLVDAVHFCDTKYFYRGELCPETFVVQIADE